MSAIDALDLPAISASSPAGENMEFSAAFGELERAAQGKPEQQYGEVIVAAEEPDYKAVEAQALALLESTRDLRILVHLAIARLQLRGVTAFAGTLAATRHVLDTSWESVHPQLDPEDDNDPTMRANALLRLGDPARVLRVLRDLPLAQTPRAGRISWRDVAASAGTIEPPPDREKLTEATIRGIFAETDRARLQGLRAALAQAEADAAALPAAFDAHCGFGCGPDLSELVKLLRELGRTIDKFMPRADDVASAQDLCAASVPGDEAAAVAAAPESGAGQWGAIASVAAPAARPRAIDASMLTAANTRAEALHLIDLACDYYDRNEPSSPLPLLLRRARRLADMGFIDILRDLAPDGLGQAQVVTGAGDA